jgi:hypothetical protein
MVCIIGPVQAAHDFVTFLAVLECVVEHDHTVAGRLVWNCDTSSSTKELATTGIESFWSMEQTKNCCRMAVGDRMTLHTVVASMAS